MNADIPSSAPNSGRTSTSEQAPRPASEQGPTPQSEQTVESGESRLSESEYLARESALTRAALVRTFDDLKKSLRMSADVRIWTRRHPWAALGVAAVAGFSAATVVTAKRTAKANTAGDTNGQKEHSGHDSSSTTLAATIFSALFDLAKVALETSIAAAAAQPPSDNEHAHERSDSQSSAES